MFLSTETSYLKSFKSGCLGKGNLRVRLNEKEMLNVTLRLLKQATGITLVLYFSLYFDHNISFSIVKANEVEEKSN